MPACVPACLPACQPVCLPAGAGYASQLSEFVRSDDATSDCTFFGHLIDKISLEASKNHILGIKFDLE
jgi:hypothetical protein